MTGVVVPASCGGTARVLQGSRGQGYYKFTKLLCGSFSSDFAVEGIFRDHSRDNALNVHEIQDFCILAIVLDVLNLTLKGIVKIWPV